MYMEDVIVVAFEPFSAVLMEKLSLIKDDRGKQKLLRDVLEDRGFKLHDFRIAGQQSNTYVYPNSRLRDNRDNTLEIAKDLNKNNI